MSFNNFFPTRHGSAQGTSAENRMLNSVGGAGGIRTKIVQNPDGSQTMLRTRGGFPEFTTIVKKAEQQLTDRTFVFRRLGSTLAVVANRFGSGMKVVVRDLVCGVVAYAVGALRTDNRAKWSDVVRINDLAVKINGKDPAPVVATVPNYGSTAVPYVASYSASCVGDSLRSTLFIGRNHGIVSISTTGTARSVLEADLVSRYSSTFSAALRADKNGKFSMYGARILGDAYRSLEFFDTYSCVITATETSPYLAISGSNGGRVELLTDYGQWGNWTTTSSHPYPPVEGATNYTYTVDVVPTGVGFPAFAYAGSDLVVEALPVFSGNSVRIKSKVVVGDIHIPDLVTTDDARTMQCATSVRLTNALTGDIVSLELQSVAESYYHTVTTQTEMTTTAGGSGTDTYAAGTKDYIYADFDNDVTVALEASISGMEDVISYLDGSLQTDVLTLTCVFKLAYVLIVKGVRTEFSVYDSDVCALIPGGRPMFNPNAHTLDIHDGPLKVPAIIAPMFMNQGACPFIAYTTKEEDAAGATPEIYLDMTLKPEDMYIGAGQVVTDGVVRFIPSNLTIMVQRYLQGVAPHLDLSALATGWIGNTTLGAAVFPPATPFRLQFANGAKGSWQSQLGEGFTDNPSMEITRI